MLGWRHLEPRNTVGAQEAYTRLVVTAQLFQRQSSRTGMGTADLIHTTGIQDNRFCFLLDWQSQDPLLIIIPDLVGKTLKNLCPAKVEGLDVLQRSTLSQTIRYCKHFIFIKFKIWIWNNNKTPSKVYSTKFKKQRLIF